VLADIFFLIFPIIWTNCYCNTSSCQKTQSFFPDKAFTAAQGFHADLPAEDIIARLLELNLGCV